MTPRVAVMWFIGSMIVGYWTNSNPIGFMTFFLGYAIFDYVDNLVRLIRKKV
jgi:hypothetical protein